MLSSALSLVLCGVYRLHYGVQFSTPKIHPAPASRYAPSSPAEPSQLQQPPTPPGRTPGRVSSFSLLMTTPGHYSALGACSRRILTTIKARVPKVRRTQPAPPPATTQASCTEDSAPEALPPTPATVRMAMESWLFESQQESPQEAADGDKKMVAPRAAATPRTDVQGELAQDRRRLIELRQRWRKWYNLYRIDKRIALMASTMQRCDVHAVWKQWTEGLHRFRRGHTNAFVTSQLFKAHGLFRTRYVTAGWNAWRQHYETHQAWLRQRWQAKSLFQRLSLSHSFRRWLQEYREPAAELPELTDSHTVEERRDDQDAVANTAGAKLAAMTSTEASPATTSTSAGTLLPHVLPPRSSPRHYVQGGPQKAGGTCGGIGINSTEGMHHRPAPLAPTASESPKAVMEASTHLHRHRRPPVPSHDKARDLPGYASGRSQSQRPQSAPQQAKPPGEDTGASRLVRVPSHRAPPPESNLQPRTKAHGSASYIQTAATRRPETSKR